MKAALGPLASTPGVQLAMLVSEDGMPIVVRGEARQSAANKERIEDAEVLAALAAGWIADIVRATAPISWSPPRHISMRASRGTLLAMQAPRALLIVVLGSGMRQADLRVPMEAAVARIERSLRPSERRTAAGSVPTAEPRGIHPAPWPDADEASGQIGQIDKNQNHGTTEPYGPFGE